MGSFVAAGTAYANLGVQMIPFYIYYSMFGFQRVGDLIWLAADEEAFAAGIGGGTSGRTTLNGEGLQHEDGHSQVVASTVPTIVAYDPAYAYELAVIIQDGLRRMYVENENIFFYLSVYNEAIEMPPMPEGVTEGILKGMYRLKTTEGGQGQVKRPQLFGSGTILPGVLKAQAILKDKYGIGCDVWSVTSYNELSRDAMSTTRWNRLHPGETPKKSFIETSLAGAEGPFISASDNIRAWADQVREWIPGTYTVLGTDGFGRSDTRPTLRRHFEVDAECTVYATLHALAKDGAFDKSRLPQVIQELGIDPEKVDPRTA
jgi:pyruvate dehydrogenase E1 component